jgi:MmyB-like transcription regulator ligand binding domain/Helix-turn-helix domain
MTTSGGGEWRRRAELTHLLKACRGRLARSASGGRRNGLRQEDAASLAGLSLRSYAAFERAEVIPASAVVDSVATALQMTSAERSALHVLAAGQDPPRPVGAASDGPSPQASQPLRDLVTQMGPYPGALTDEMWTIRFRNPAMSAWAGGWYDRVPPEQQNLVLYLFSEHGADLLPDVHVHRRFSIAVLRYQYTRNISSPRFADLVSRLLATGDEAAELWERHEVEFPPHEYPVRLRHPAHGIIKADVAMMPVYPRLWLYAMVLPAGIEPPTLGSPGQTAALGELRDLGAAATGGRTIIMFNTLISSSCKHRYCRAGCT